MMIRALLLLPVLLFSAAASAADEPLSVRAGEHGEYSRLVIPKAPADWKIATSDRKIEITFPDKDYEFDLSDILDKRKAHRVLNARIVDTDTTRALVLSLTCDCPVRTSKSPENSIVVDIFNAAPTIVAEEELEEKRPISLDARNSQPQTPENMRAARDRMIALLAEARSQGVVQLKIDDERREEKQHAAQEKKAASEPTPAAHSPEPAKEQQSAPAPDPHSTPLREHAIESALKPAPSEQPHAVGPPVLLTQAAHEEDDNCADPTLFHELENEDEALDYSSITNLRQKFDLSDDEDERRDVAATLAIAYLHIGFFEEASAIANPRAREGDVNLAVAAALADIAIGSTSRATRTLSPLRACGAFGEMAYAAAAKPEDENVTPMQNKHVEALRPLMPVLRAPLAETLALNAIDRGDMTIAKEFYDLARSARGRERSPALAVLENLLAEQIASSHSKNADAPAEQHAAAPVISEQLKELAQEPGPMQAKALAILAKDYEKRADVAYEGLLDDIAAQTSRRDTSLSDARASFTGAKALVTAGRLHEGVAVLDSAAKAAPAASSASQKLAQSFIMNGLLQDDKTRLDAVSAFFYFRDFVDAKDDGDINIAIARELASYGANSLLDRALDGAPEAWRAQGDALRAQSHLNSGDAHGALNLVNAGKKSADISVVAVKAHERLNDRAGSVAVIKSAMRDGASDNELANAAWRAGEWPLVNEAFTAVPKKERETNAASRAALAALNAGASAMSPAVREALASDPATLAALAHMFVSAPAVNIRAIDMLADFAKGVTKETDFMERGLSAGGDGR